MSPVELIEYVAERLGNVRGQVTFLGGAVVALLVNEQGAKPPRPTNDVDVAIELSSRIGFYELEEALRACGFHNAIEGPICRFKHGAIILDVMPTDPAILGFSNRSSNVSDGDWNKLVIVSITLEEFVQKRPHLFHMTSESNIQLIKTGRELFSVRDLLESAGRERLVRTRRTKSMDLRSNGLAVSLRDQELLSSGNIELQHGWTFSDVVEMLNNYVYFWPGDSNVPGKYGARHFARYEQLGEKLVMLRVSSSELLSANPNNHPKFSRYNSGAPRCSGGKRSPRGDDTFQSAGDFAGTPSLVVEVVFKGSVRLPDAVDYGKLKGDRWQAA